MKELVDKLLEQMTEEELRTIASAPMPSGFIDMAKAPILAELDYRRMLRAAKEARARIDRLPWWRRIFQ